MTHLYKLAKFESVDEKKPPNQMTNAEKTAGSMSKFVPSVPTVSVIVPTRNNSRTILSLLRSLYEQSYSDFEVILVDSSTDGTVELAAKHYPIRVVREKRLGLNVARNSGIHYARAYTD
jgi:alpha-1,6-rhamnosyltransferase